MQISVAILVTVNRAKGYIEKIIKSFIARVNSLGGIFEAKLCLTTALRELDTIGLLEKASLVITPNAYGIGVIYDVVPNTSLGDLTVERATTGSRVNKTGLIQTEGINVPRLDYSKGTCPSWLIEPQETNIFNYSEQFDNPFWLKGAIGGVALPIVDPDQAISPDGTLTADQVDFPIVGAGQTSIIFVPFSTATTENYTQSFYIKGLLGTEVIWITYTTDGVNFLTKACNLTTGWQRFDLTLLNFIGGNNITIGVDTRDSLQTIRPAQTIFLWGGQLELNTYATSYIKTVATTVTRNLDKISKVGISSLLNPSQGVFYIEAAALNKADADSRAFNLNDVTGDNYVAIQFQADGDLRFDIRSGININRLTIPIDTTIFNKFAISWGPLGIFGYVNGVKYTIPQFAGTIPAIPIALTRISFFRGSSTNIANSYLKESVVFKTQLTDAECILLTAQAPSTIVIGTQTWTTDNLEVETYSNGDVIPQVTNETTWDNLTTGAWCYYDNLIENGAVYGKLYNWYAINDPRGLAPKGFHVPSSDEFNTLRTYLGGILIAGGAMKSTGNILTGDGLWRSPNTGATNSSGFTALPGGRRTVGSFGAKTETAEFWSSTELNIFSADNFRITYASPSFTNPNGENKTKGFSVRLIKNT